MMTRKHLYTNPLCHSWPVLKLQTTFEAFRKIRALKNGNMACVTRVTRVVIH